MDEHSSENEKCDNASLGITPLKDNFCFDPSQTLPKSDWSNEDYNDELVRAVDLAEKVTNDQNFINVDELERKINLEMERIRKSNEHTPARRTRRPITDHSDNRASNINPTVRRRLVKDSPKPKRKYNLESVYESLTGRKMENAHQAEADTLALLECLTAVGKPILEWFDKNKIQFRSVKRMW